MSRANHSFQVCVRLCGSVRVNVSVCISLWVGEYVWVCVNECTPYTF